MEDHQDIHYILSNENNPDDKCFQALEASLTKLIKNILSKLICLNY